MDDVIQMAPTKPTLWRLAPRGIKISWSTWEYWARWPTTVIFKGCHCLTANLICVPDMCHNTEKTFDTHPTSTTPTARSLNFHATVWQKIAVSNLLWITRVPLYVLHPLKNGLLHWHNTASSLIQRRRWKCEINVCLTLSAKSYLLQFGAVCNRRDYNKVN